MLTKSVHRSEYAGVYFPMTTSTEVSPMASETVRIKPDTHSKLKELASKAGESMPETLDKAIDAYYRQQFLEDVNRAYAALRADPKAWAEELAERRAIEGTLSDGLEDT